MWVISISLSTDVRVPGVVFEPRWLDPLWQLFFDYQRRHRTKWSDTHLQPQGKYDNPGTLVATEVKCASLRTAR